MIRYLRQGLARRKRRFTVAALVLVALALAAGVWAGGGAGFTRVSTSTTISLGGSGTSTVATAADSSAATTGGPTLTATLRIDFRDVFGSADVATITASVDHASFVWECFTNSGNNPKAVNKGTAEARGSVVSQQFPVDRNGNVTGFLVLSSSVDGSFCPSGQETHVFARFVDINLADNATPPHTYHQDSATTDTLIY
jgi:hypothetical protein